MNESDINFAHLEQKHCPLPDLTVGQRNVWVKGRVTKKVGVRSYQRRNAAEEEHKFEFFIQDAQDAELKVGLIVESPDAEPQHFQEDDWVFAGTFVISKPAKQFAVPKSLKSRWNPR